MNKYRTGGLSELLKIKKAPGAKRKIPEAASDAYGGKLRSTQRRVKDLKG
ncbi:hypothetical protein [Nostoc sp.]